MGLATLLILYAVQNPQAIEAVGREIEIYDSLNNNPQRYKYAWEITNEELEAMEEDRIFEGKPYKNTQKGGKKHGN